MYEIVVFCLLVSSLTSQSLDSTVKPRPAPLWGKCGGMNWNGPVTCPEKAYCRFFDAWYSQCVPDNRPTQTTSDPDLSTDQTTTTIRPITTTTRPITTTTTTRPLTTTTTIRPITTTTRPITTTTTTRPLTTTTTTRPITTTTTAPTKPILTTTTTTTVASPLTMDPEGGGFRNALITEDEFVNALTSNGYPRPTSAQYRSYSSQLQSAGGITTKREAAMFLAQVIHESGGLRYKSELACAADGCPNAYKLTPGIGIPGKRYFGRGYIQLTWDYNYRAASKALYNDDRLIQNPDQVALDEQVSWATAFWFWKSNVGPDSQVKAGKFGASTNKINGALECRGANLDKARKRFEYYKKVLTAFHVTEAPIESGCYN